MMESKSISQKQKITVKSQQCYEKVERISYIQKLRIEEVKLNLIEMGFSVVVISGIYQKFKESRIEM